MMVNNRQLGISLSEYGLLIALVALVGVIAVSVFGGNLDGMLQGVGASIADATPARAGNAAPSTNNPATSPARSNILEDSDFSDIPMERSTIEHIKGYQRICVDSKLCVRLPVVDGGAVTTTGGNGGQLTREFAKVLLQLAEQMEADPDGEHALAAKVRQLANKGHEMADYQRLHLASDNSPTTIGNQVSEQIRAAKLARIESRAASTLAPLQEELKPQFEVLLGDVQSYLTAHPESISPAGAALINLESQQIMAVVDSYSIELASGSADNKAQADVSSFFTSRKVTATFQTQAELTEQSANTICKTGAQGQGCIRASGNAPTR